MAILAMPNLALAFGGFYVGTTEEKLLASAARVTLVRDADTTVAAIQATYSGPMEDFALIVPVPRGTRTSSIRALPSDTLDWAHDFTAPRLLEVWRGPPTTGPVTFFVEEPEPMAATPEATFDGSPFKDVSFVEPSDSAGFIAALESLSFHVSRDLRERVRPLVNAGYSFYVVPVDVSKLDFRDGQAVLPPVQVRYQAQTFELHIQPGLVNAGEWQDLVIFTVGDTRYEVENRPHVFVGSESDVPETVKSSFPEHYERRFLHATNAIAGVVATEFAGTVAFGCFAMPCQREVVGKEWPLTRLQWSEVAHDVLIETTSLGPRENSASLQDGADALSAETAECGLYRETYPALEGELRTNDGRTRLWPEDARSTCLGRAIEDVYEDVEFYGPQSFRMTLQEPTKRRFDWVDTVITRLHLRTSSRANSSLMFEPAKLVVERPDPVFGRPEPGQNSFVAVSVLDRGQGLRRMKTQLLPWRTRPIEREERGTGCNASDLVLAPLLLVFWAVRRRRA